MRVVWHRRSRDACSRSVSLDSQKKLRLASSGDTTSTHGQRSNSERQLGRAACRRPRVAGLERGGPLCPPPPSACWPARFSSPACLLHVETPGDYDHQLAASGEIPARPMLQRHWPPAVVVGAQIERNNVYHALRPPAIKTPDFAARS